MTRKFTPRKLTRSGAIQVVPGKGALSYQQAREWFMAQPGPLIYRGQEDDWALLPAIARYRKLGDPLTAPLPPDLFQTLDQTLDCFRQEARRLDFVRDWPVGLHSGPKFSEGGLKKRMELLENLKWEMLAQHYGVPTRLIDWSSSYQAALFFAYGGWSGAALTSGMRPCVWCLNRNAMEKGGIGVDSRWNDEPTYEDYLLSEDAIHILHQDQIVNPRQRAQRGWFTYARNAGSIEKHIKKYEGHFEAATLIQVRLRIDCQKDALLDLGKGGASAAAIRHDLEGVSRDAMNQFFRFKYATPKPSKKKLVLASDK